MKVWIAINESAYGFNTLDILAVFLKEEHAELFKKETESTQFQIIIVTREVIE